VNGVFHRETIAGPRTKVPERRETDYGFPIDRHKHGIALLPAGLPPVQAVCNGDWMVGVNGRGFFQNFVVDGRDAFDIVGNSVSDEHGSSTKRS
jgi:hypothetical protein